MPDLNTTRSLLEADFISSWGVTTPIRFDNVDFDESSITDFVSIKFINATSDNVCVGSQITKRIRHTGIIAVKIYTKQNIGTGAAYTYADLVKGYLSNKTFTDLFTTASEIRRNGEEESGWYSLIVNTPYVSDEQ